MGDLDVQSLPVDTMFHIRKGAVPSQTPEPPPTAAEQITAFKILIAMCPTTQFHRNALITQGIRPDAVEAVFGSVREDFYARIECLLTGDAGTLASSNVVKMRPRNDRTPAKDPKRGA